VGQQGELQDVDSRWQEAYGVEADGALLIRPDGFVAWRQSEGADNHREVLMKVVEQLFGKVHQQGEVYASGRSHKL
jgi:hypothetical protein